MYVKIQIGERILMVRMSDEQFDLLKYLKQNGCLPDNLRYNEIQFDLLD